MKSQKPIKELLEFSIINLDKPSGPTSFGAIEIIKKKLGLRKVGHFGTLDPKVTGVLPFALNRACKLSNYFMKKDKEYVGKMRVHAEVSKDKLEKEMKKFIGEIMQKPPVKSRVKRVLRPRTVHKFEITEISTDGKDVSFHTDVQAGTYIRKLISDLGEKIGGAHMIELRRSRAGIFYEKDSHTTEEIIEAFEKYKKGDETALRNILIPAEIIKELITSVQANSEAVAGLLNGKPLMKLDVKAKVPNSDLFSVFSGERFIGIYKRFESKDSEDLDIIAKPEFVMN